MPDFLPRRDADLLAWFKNFSSVLNNFYDAWSVPQAIAKALSARVSAYETAYGKACGEDGTKALRAEKNGIRDEMKTFVRRLKNKYINYNDEIGNPERVRLRLKLVNAHRARIPAPTVRPQLEVRPTANRQHRASAVSGENGRKGKPAGVYIVRYAWSIADSAPSNPDHMSRSAYRTRTVKVFDYKESDRGKKIFYAARYENAKGEPGPWSNIVYAIIP
jgi:hypothetical protein